MAFLVSLQLTSHWSPFTRLSTTPTGKSNCSCMLFIKWFYFISGLHTNTHPFTGPLSRTTRVSQYQKGKTSLDLLKQEIVSGSGISWAICKSAPRSRQITTPAPHHSVFCTGRMPFLPPSQQRQSTDGISTEGIYIFYFFLFPDYKLQIFSSKNQSCPRPSLMLNRSVSLLKAKRFKWPLTSH